MFFFIIFEINQLTMEDTLKKLRNLIRTYRLKKGYSQENMAELLGISQSSYTNIESGKNKLTIDKLLEIIQLLDIPHDDFMQACEKFFQNIKNMKIH